MDLRVPHAEASDVDPVEPQHRDGTRESARGTAASVVERLVQAEPSRKQVIGVIAPVVEVAADDQRRAMRRQLQDYMRRVQGQVKVHEEQPTGHISQLFPQDDYGFLEAADGTEIYFHRHSVLGDRFDALKIGAAVRYVREQGEEGPQASTVEPL